MRLSRSRICATAILVLFVTAGAGCALVSKVRAKNELNEAAKSYNEQRTATHSTARLDGITSRFR